MTQHFEESAVRKYLLGELEGEEPGRRVEERLLLDPDFWAELEEAEDDLIDDYVRGALGAGERASFERHFLSTPERLEKLAFARVFNRRLTPAPEVEVTSAPARTQAPAPRRFAWLRWPQVPRYVTAAALAVVVLAAALLVWRVFFRRPDLSEGLAALRAAYGDVRPVEPRVSGLGYGRLAETRGAGGGPADPDARRRAERLLGDALHERPGPDTRHALGRLYLYERKFDDAIRHLEVAAAEAPGDARLQSDLGAALLERGKDAQARGDGGPADVDFARALERFDAALKLDPALKDALFNRALALEYMRLDADAAAAWRAYLEQDADAASPWAAEARQRLSRLEERQRRGEVEREGRFGVFTDAFRARDAERAWAPLGLSRSRAGNKVVERILDAYFERGAAGGGSRESLDMLSFAGEVEERKTGDRFTAELARFYRGAGAPQLAAAARGRALMREAAALFDRAEFEKAAEVSADARREFGGGGDACEALLAEQWEGVCRLRIPEAEKAAATFERLAETSEERGYAALRAQALQALCDANTSLAEPTRAREYADRALGLSESIGYGENIVRCFQSYTGLDRQARRYRESLAWSRRGIDLALEVSSDPKLLWNFYAEAGLNYSELDLGGAALAYEGEALRLALLSKWPVIVERSYARLSQVHLKLRDTAAAVRYADLAVEQGRHVAGVKSRDNIVANALRHLGHVYRQAGDHARALESYDQSLALYAGLGLKVYDLEARRGKLLSYRALGDDEAAGREIEALLARLGEYRRNLREVQNRDSFFDASQNVYDAAAEFAYTRRGDPRAAFDLAEGSHARTLLDLMRSNAEEAGGPAGPDLRPALTTEALGFEEIRRRMPERAQILLYHVLEDRLLVWLVSRGRELESRSLGLGRAELDAKVDAYVGMVSRGEGEDDGRRASAAKELYAVLIAPLEPSLDAGGRLCIVADKRLHLLPFASLVSPASGRHLFEERTLLDSPSASVFVVASEAARGRAGARAETLLSVGDPRFDRDKFRDLPALPSAGREAGEVAALYGARPLTGGEAGEEEVTRAMRDADVIHLASHYVADERWPLLSRLLLAPKGRGGADDGELQALEVYRMKLPRARLVVLSACRTNGERLYRGEGADGIARPFIAAGAPLVVASRWPVESAPTADLMVSFHRHRRLGGLPTAEAFRRAQLDMLNGPDLVNRQPRHWAAFTLIGGSADF
ncbi:MAG TPA: CHAT domain-containing protein [Pyrinomonadaceae bacterium]|jgi:CHAT domain-containing protein